MNIFPITNAGYNALKKKLEDLKVEFETLPQIIAHARSKGDLKENAEYHAAKERQGMLNAEISKINSDLQSSKIIDPSTLPKDMVTFGKIVELKSLKDGTITSYTLLGPCETQFYNNAISVTSLVAKAVLSKKLNDSVKVITPSGEKNFTITNISIASPK